MPHSVLQEDWSEYDNRMIRDKRDGSKFSCEVDWEVDYLVKKLAKLYPKKSTTEIHKAITDTCDATSTRTRKDFVERVEKKLK